MEISWWSELQFELVTLQTKFGVQIIWRPVSGSDQPHFECPQLAQVMHPSTIRISN